ncbi:MAG: hypothetical protein IJY18_01230 [Clostridia bacterium]|nr:hypothetical protein [Clostridia bacterium]
MKSRVIKLIALALTLVSVFALAACGDSYSTYYYDPSTGKWSENEVSSGGNNNVGSGNNDDYVNNGSGNNNNNYDDGALKVEVSGITQDITYVDEDGMSIPVLNSDLEIGTKYTLKLNFTITATQNSDGNQYFDTVLTFTDINILNGTIKEAETGKQVEQKVIDATSGSERKDIKLSFKVPSEKDVEKQITILVALTPIKVANSSQMLVDFSSDDAKILGDGISRSFSINRATLAKPVLTVDSGNKKISWAAVNNATYYMVYSDTGVTGIVINATDALELDLYNYPDLIGQNIYVQACSDSTDFIASEKSEPVTIW